MMPAGSLRQLTEAVVSCDRCPRLRRHCLRVAQVRRAAYRQWEYWGRPVPGFGDPRARLWIIGLAPGAHGANRTGRVFTGDRSGDFLYAALHRAGLANQPTSTSRDDGLELRDCFISAAARCAPPDNKPSPREIARCARFLDAEWAMLRRKHVILALGKIAWDAAIRLSARQGYKPAQRVEFAHGAFVPLPGDPGGAELGGTLVLVGSYHVSQQNTFTGRLTAASFDAVLGKCLELVHAQRPLVLTSPDRRRCRPCS